MTPLLLALLLSLAAPKDGSGDVQIAERAYRAGDFSEAQARHLAALSEPGAPEGPLLYNLGNCAYRLGDYAEAVLHFRRALLRMPRDREARFNLRLAERRLGLDPAPRGPAAALFALTDPLTARELLFLASGLQSAGLLALVLLRRRRRRLARLVPAFALLLGLALAVRLVQREWIPGLQAGVVLEPELPLFPSPRSDLPPISSLRAGELVRIHASTPDHLRLSSPRARGWAERRGVGLVD